MVGCQDGAPGADGNEQVDGVGDGIADGVGDGSADGLGDGHAGDGDANPADQQPVLEYLSFTCTDDLHVENGSKRNDEILRIENSTTYARVRTAYLRFEIDGINGDDIAAATLRMRNVDAAPRTGTYLVSIGSHAAWSELSTVAELPAIEGSPIATVSGAIDIGEMLNWSLTDAVGRDGTLTLILHMDLDTGDDLALSALEGTWEKAELDLVVLRP